MSEQPDPDGAPPSLSEAMGALASRMQRSHRSVDDTLVAITRGACEMIAGADHATITLVTGRRRVESRAPTGDLPIWVDALQHDLGEGPCLDAVYEHQTTVVADLRTETRWPRFSPAAVDLGVRSMLSFQLFTDDRTLGALNLVSRTPDAFTADDVDLGTHVATHAAIALIGAVTERNLESALINRDVIGQAKGIVMERYDLDAVGAFEMIRTLSQQLNVPVTEIAGRITRRAD